MSLFDTDTWRERMDERWFDTGAAMAEAGAVDLVSIEDEKVTAHVTGSVGDLYVVELRAPAGEGSGDRPAKKRNRSRSRTRGGRPAAAGESS